MINLENVTVIKSGVKLFEDLTLKIKNNEHYVISGSNGSGKTILLELIAGLNHPAKGKINYDFIQSDSWEDFYWERKRKIRFIPTHALQTLIPSSNALYYQQRYYTHDKESSPLVKDILGNESLSVTELPLPKNLDIHSLFNIEITRLSNGQLKKILLLKSLLKEKPSVLLLDYPFEGLDSGSREDLSQFIDWIGRTYSIQIILVDQSHHLPSIITTRLIVENFKIKKEEKIQPEVFTKSPTKETSLSEETLSAYEPVIEIKNLKIQYGEKIILENFNWRVFRGERWALTGKNGSGKTTIFSLIFADHPLAYSQQVYLFGKRRGTGDSIWDIKKRITYIGPELVSYLNPASIQTLAKAYIKMLNKKTDDRLLANLIQYFNAEQFINKPVRALSSGQLQLTLIISSLLSDTELLLLDEPFQFLDTIQKERVSSYLQQHIDHHKTLILITHYEQDIADWTRLRKEI